MARPDLRKTLDFPLRIGWFLSYSIMYSPKSLISSNNPEIVVY